MVDQKIKARAVHRVKIIQGQLEGLLKSLLKEDYCTDLLHQSLSIQKSLKSLDRLLLENHLRTHVKQQFGKKGQEEKAITELIEVYTLSHQ